MLSYWFTDSFFGIFGNFSIKGEKYYFTQGEIEPREGDIEMNIKNVDTLKKLKSPFWLQMIFDKHLSSATILLAILDGSHNQKLQK